MIGLRVPVRLAWAVSGEGRIVRAVFEAIDLGLLRVEMATIITDRPSVIEEAARTRGVPVHRIEPGPDPYHPDLAATLTRHRADWLGLTFNRLLSEEVLASIGGRVFNLHLSLLPVFPGFHAVARALSHGLRLTGVTVHLIDACADTGPILAQAAVAVGARDTPIILGRRLFEAALPLALGVVRAIGEGEITFESGHLDWPRARAVETPARGVFPTVDEDLIAFAARFSAKLAEG